MSSTSPRYARVNWDEIPDNPKFPRHAGYRHPWATNVASDYHSRDLDGPLGLREMSVVWVRMGPGQSGTHHRHATAEELHLVIAGACQMMIGDEVLELRTRDSVVVRPELDRSFHNHTDQDCWLIVIGAPITEFTIEGLSAYLAANGYPPDTVV
jgi:mannose-6-phosphate isomerase-like protein (cupin superfamily)